MVVPLIVVVVTTMPGGRGVCQERRKMLWKGRS